MEIERKYLIDEKNLPADLESCRSVLIEQGYLCRKPVVRIRRQEEYNLPLGAEGYAHLKEKIDGKLISKRRYLIPMENGLTIELDVFYEPCKGLLLAEVEFPDEASANSFCPPAWFGEDVTFDGRYHNSYLSR